jgi:hypothetical protein
MTTRPVEDADLLLDALAYVTELYHEITAENGAPQLGTQNQVVDFIRADPALAAYVRDWARRRDTHEAHVEPPERLPRDDVYRRVREAMERSLREGPEAG